jgi:hypothetical protein
MAIIKNNNRGSPVKNDIIKAVLTYIQSDSVQYAIMINGAWGIGKTHFVQNEVMPAADQIEFIYLSLYGLTSLQDLENLIQSKLAVKSVSAKRDKNVKTFQRAAVTQAEQSAVLVQGDFNLTQNNRTAKLVLCLDDLERWSGDLDQCLSYVNRLVDQENYKCILVGNIDEISETEMPAFANAREKTIRHVFQFENSYKAIFDIALGLPSYSSKISRRFLRSMVKNNQLVLQRLLDRVGVKNIRTVSEAFQLYEYVFRRNSKLFQANRSLAFAYLMALQSALILVNKFLLAKDYRKKLMTQDHTEGKGFKYLSEIGYFDDDSSEFLTDDARYLLDTIFYRMDQISLKGLFSIVRNGYYLKSDFEGNFENWRREQQYDTYLDKEKFYRLDDAQALKVFNEMYACLVDKKSVINPITILLLAERIIEDMAAGVIKLNPVHFKASIIDAVDHLYESGNMQSVEVSIFDLSGDRFINCRGIYNHVLKRNQVYQRAAEEHHVGQFWKSLLEKTQSLESLMAEYNPASIFAYQEQAEVVLDSLDSLNNDRLHLLTNWVESGIGERNADDILNHQSNSEIQKLVEIISRKYEAGVGITAAQFRRLSRKLRSKFLDGDFHLP